MNKTAQQASQYALQELEFESSIGDVGEESQDIAIPMIDMTDFDQRFFEIAEQLWAAATDVGFFQLIHHGISLDSINRGFSAAESFFSLDQELKARYPLRDGLNAGWEYMEQVRPSTGVADQKESYQVTLPNMQGLWPDPALLPDFRRQALELELHAWMLGMRVLSCFAHKLGFSRDFFTVAHDREQTDYQCTLRLLHYLALPEDTEVEDNMWRAGAHTDFDCLTMVFQKAGQGGLQVCAGKDATEQRSWSPVNPIDGVITCNIGDMLMRWSDDKLKSTLHRVQMPKAGEYRGARHSMAFFCQANKGMIIQGPLQTYEPISAQDYLNMRISANFAQ